MENRNNFIKQPQGLISVLLDENAREDERDDAALDLRNFDQMEALCALLTIIMEEKNRSLVDTIAESIAVIWSRNNSFDWKAYEKMPPFAQQCIVHTIQNVRPELIEKLGLK